MKIRLVLLLKKGLVWSIFCGGWASPMVSAEESKLAIVTATKADVVGDFAEVAFSSRDDVALLERRQMSELISELKLQDGNSRQSPRETAPVRVLVGNLEGADWALFLDGASDRVWDGKAWQMKNLGVFARLAHVETGELRVVRLFSETPADPEKTAAAIVEAVVEKLREQDQVREGKKIEVSVSGIFADLFTAETAELQRQFHNGLLSELSKRPDLVVLDRRNLAAIGFEKSLESSSDSGLTFSKVSVGGKFSGPASDGGFTLTLAVEDFRKNPSETVELKIQGNTGRFAESIREAAEKLAENFSESRVDPGAAEEGRGPNSEAEIARLIRLSDWALMFQEFEVSLSAAESALTLSNDESLPALLRVARGESLRAVPIIKGLTSRHTLPEFSSMTNLYVSNRNPFVREGAGFRDQLRQAIVAQQLLSIYLKRSKPVTRAAHRWDDPVFFTTSMTAPPMALLDKAQTGEERIPEAESLRAIVRENLLALGKLSDPLSDSQVQRTFEFHKIESLHLWTDDVAEALRVFDVYLKERQQMPSEIKRNFVLLSQVVYHRHPLPIRGEEEQAEAAWLSYIEKLSESDQIQDQILGFGFAANYSGVRPEILPAYVEKYIEFLIENKAAFVRNPWQDFVDGKPFIDALPLNDFQSKVYREADFSQEQRDRIAPILVDIIQNGGPNIRPFLKLCPYHQRPQYVEKPWKPEDAEALRDAVNVYLQSTWAKNEVPPLLPKNKVSKSLNESYHFNESAYLGFAIQDGQKWLAYYFDHYADKEQSVEPLHVDQVFIINLLPEFEKSRYETQFQRLGPKYYLADDRTLFVTTNLDIVAKVDLENFSASQIIKFPPEHLPSPEKMVSFRAKRIRAEIGADENIVVNVVANFLVAKHLKTGVSKSLELPEENEYGVTVHRGKAYLTHSKINSPELSGLLVWDFESGELQPVVAARNFQATENPVGQNAIRPFFKNDQLHVLGWLARSPNFVISRHVEENTWERLPGQFTYISPLTAVTGGVRPHRHGHFYSFGAQLPNSPDFFHFVVTQLDGLGPGDEKTPLTIKDQKWKIRSELPTRPGERVLVDRGVNEFWAIRHSRSMPKTYNTLYRLGNENESLEIPLAFESRPVKSIMSGNRTRFTLSNPSVDNFGFFASPHGIGIFVKSTGASFWFIPRDSIDKWIETNQTK